MFGRKKRGGTSKPLVQTVPKNKQQVGFLGAAATEYQSRAERALYESMREAVPIIDAAVEKIIRLIGSFKVETDNRDSSHIANEFVKNVQSNGTALGLNSFAYSYLDSLLTYGEAVGEMILDRGRTGVAAVYNASLNDVEIRSGGSPLSPVVYLNDSDGVKPYDIMIEKVDADDDTGQNMVIKVTDEELLEKTGGIVQGMSGSPIVQNGKLVGAVTHVFVNSPKTGFGIAVGNMLESYEKYGGYPES